MESRWVGFSGHRLFPPFVAPSAGREPSRLLRAAAVARTVFDSHDRPVRIWVGTNDTPASGTWSPTNNAGSSNMVEVSSLLSGHNSNNDNWLQSPIIEFCMVVSANTSFMAVFSKITTLRICMIWFGV